MKKFIKLISGLLGVILIASLGGCFDKKKRKL